MIFTILSVVFHNWSSYFRPQHFSNKHYWVVLFYFKYVKWYFYFEMKRQLCISGMTETKGWMKYTHTLEIIPGIPYSAMEMISTNLFPWKKCVPYIWSAIPSFFFMLFLIDLSLCMISLIFHISVLCIPYKP